MGTRKRIEQAEKGTIRMMYFSVDLVILPVTMDVLGC